MSEDDKGRDSKIPSWQVPQERQPESDAYHIWTSRPLLRSVYWKPVPAPPHELVSSSYEVFVDQRAWLAMHNHVWQTPATKVPFGYLVGDLCEDPNANRRFVIVTGAVPARFDFAEEAPDQISREAGLALRLEIDRQRGTLVGWYHRHLDGAVELSEQDLATHHARFVEPWQCAFLFVGADSGSKGGCFRSASAGVSSDLAFPFYEMASNESLLPRGIKRSYLDWDNYATVDEIRSEPPERPGLLVLAQETQGPIVESSSELPVEPEVEPEAEAEPEVVVEPEVEPEAEAEPAIDWDLDVLGEVVEGQGPDAEDSDLLDAESGTDSFDSDPIRFDLDETPEEVAEVAEELVIDVEPESTTPPTRVETGHEDPVAEEPTVPAESKSFLDLSASVMLEDEPGQPVRRPNRRFQGLVVSLYGKSKKRQRMVALVIGGLIVASAVIVGLLSLTSDTPNPPGRGIDQAAGDGPVQSEAEIPSEIPATVSGDSLANVPVTREQLEQQSQEMLATISRFYGSVVGMDDGTATCDDLQAAFVIVEDGWIEYNSRYKAGFPGELPEDLGARDERLYRGVQDVEREFERSGCPRP